MKGEFKIMNSCASELVAHVLSCGKDLLRLLKETQLVN